MKKTVKVLLSLVLVCLFAFQFAGAMPASASAEHVDSKWDDITFAVKYFALDSEGKYYLLSESESAGAGVKFVGDDVGKEQASIGDFLNGDFVLTPPEGYYAADMFICAEGRDGMDSHVNLLKYALASKDSAKITIKRGALANKDNELDTDLILTDDSSSHYIINVLLGKTSETDAPEVSYNDGWLNGKVGGTDTGKVVSDDDGYTHTVISDYANYTGGETYKGMTLVYSTGASMSVEPGDVVSLYADAEITANYVVKVTATANDVSYVYGDAVPELTVAIDAPTSAGYSVSAKAVAGTPNADGTAAITVEDVVVTDASGSALSSDKLELSLIPGTLSVTKRDITISAKPISAPYSGKAVDATEWELTAGSLGTDKIDSVSFSGGPVNVGTGLSTPNGAVIKNEAGEDVTAFYNISYVGADVEVTPYTGEVVIKADDASKPYDGTALTASSASASGLLEGDSIEAKVIGEATVPGTDGVAKVDSYVIRNANGDDVTKNYSNVKLENGKLTVTKRSITITTGDAKKEYDKTPLTSKSDAYSVTSGSLLEGHKLTLTLTGTITDPGTAKNTVKEGSIKISDAQGRDYTAYYSIEVKEGTLEVTGRKVIAITVKAASAEKTYDGEPLSASNAEVVEGKLEDGDTITVDITASITNAGTTANKINKVTVKDASGNDVTGKYTITTQDGTLTVNKRALKITAKSAEKVYDGKALTANACEVSNNLVKGHKISVSVSGTQTQIGSSKNKASNAKIVDANNNDVTGNYDISYVDGTLTVKAANAKPKTGDEANMGLWIALMAVSAVVIAAGVFFFVKKNKKKNEQ